MGYEIVPATLEHAKALAADMRAEDKAECEASGYAPYDAIVDSMAGTRHPLTAISDGKVLAVFGVATPTLLSTVGSPWLLGSNELAKHAKFLLRGSRAFVEEWSHQFQLVNMIDARYSAALRWARWLGFTVHPATPFGPTGHLFHRITKD